MEIIGEVAVCTGVDVNCTSLKGVSVSSSM